MIRAGRYQVSRGSAASKPLVNYTALAHPYICWSLDSSPLLNGGSGLVRVSFYFLLSDIVIMNESRLDTQ